MSLISRESTYYHRLCDQLSTTCSSATKVAKLAFSRCSQPQPAVDNGIRDGSSNDLPLTSQFTGQYP